MATDNAVRDPALEEPISRGKQRLIVSLGVVVAFGALILAASYQADTNPSEPVLSGSAADGGGERPADANAPTEPLDVNPIEDWLPRSGIGSTCSEAVGVDLIPGYSAVLTINGTTLPATELNDPQSAGGSLGQVTYGPEEDCPNGALLRPQNNVVEACVYRITEGPENCRIYPAFTFDAL
ncbi:MAG: hypothetical protein ACI8TP_005215 [Acidimicrobiales bacterium]